MKTRAFSPVLSSVWLAIFFLVSNTPSVQAQQASANKQSQATKPAQSESNRPRIFRRFRDDGQSLRNQTAKPAGQNSQSGSGQTPSGSPATRSNAPASNPAINNLPANRQSPTLQATQQNPPRSGHYPAMRPPNRIPVPTLAPPLKMALPQTAVVENDLQPQLLDNRNSREAMPTASSAQTEHLPSVEPTQMASGPQFGIVLEDNSGKVSVVQILTDGSAYSDGLRQGDVIESIGGVPVQSQQEFFEVAGLMQAGDQVDIVVKRDDEEQKLLLSIGKVADSRTDSPSPEMHIESRTRQQQAQAGSEQRTEIPANHSDFVELKLSNSGPEDFGNMPHFDSPAPSSTTVSNQAGANSMIDTMPFDEQILRESISRKEREIQELSQQLQALKRRLANAASPSGF